MKQFTLEEKNEVLENPFIHIHRKLDVLLNIGKLLMECGADTNRIIEEKYKLILYFFDKSQLDLTALQQNVIAENMRTLRREFLLELSKDEKVKLISSLSTENVFNALDANVTGCRLFLDLTLYPDEKVC